jgi:ACS family tartrate transporter-like MFS transporter
MNEQRIFAKCAWRLIPFIALVYLVNRIDRVNVGFAALTMNKDLNFSPAIFGLGAGVFFFGYFVFQVPSGILVARVGARRWVFCMMAVWGAISAASAFVQGPASFYTLRFLLGAAEAGFTPGMIYYLSIWFPQTYRVRFTALFMAALPLAFIIGGPLSGVILGMDGVAGLHGWQWMFLLEGLPAFFLAFAALKVMRDSPASASWLTAEEKATIAARFAEDHAQHDDIWLALRDPRVIALGLVLLGIATADYGIGLWLPQIVRGMGFSNLATGFVVAVPFLASIGLMFLWGRSSDANNERIWHVALPALAAAAGLAVAGLAQSHFIVFVALTIATVGVLTSMPPLFMLPSSFLRGPAVASGSALFNAIGGLGGFFGPTIIGALKQQTGSYASGMGALSFALVMSATIVLTLGRALTPRPAIAAPAGGSA